MSDGDVKRMVAIAKHFERWIGTPTGVFHASTSRGPHVDVHVIEPQPERPFVTLFTTGMSERPMRGTPCEHVPDRLELMMTLPADWPLPAISCPGEKTRKRSTRSKRKPRLWPIRWLHDLARFPHLHDTWLGFGHTIPNGDPPQPLAPGVRFVCMLLLPPVTVPEEAWELTGPDGESIGLLALYPIYREEMDLKLMLGHSMLAHGLAAHQVTDVYDARRANVAARPMRAARLLTRLR